MTLSMSDLSKKMQKIDFCMMLTKADDGSIASRPMSNNGDVEFDGDCFFFSYTDTQKIREITADPGVTLTFTAPPSLLGKPGIFVAVKGRATLISDRAAFEAHWNRDLDRWFPEGTATPGLILIKVHADSVQYWDGEDNAILLI